MQTREQDEQRMFVHIPKKFFIIFFLKICFISVNFFLQIESKKKYLSFYFVCDFESNIIFIECRERTWWKKYLIFLCVNYFLFQNKIIQDSDNYESQSDSTLDCRWTKTEKCWFLKNWKNEIILWNVLFG